MTERKELEDRGDQFIAQLDGLREVYRVAFDAMADKRLELTNMRERMLHDPLYAEEMDARLDLFPRVPRDEAEIHRAIELNLGAVQYLYQAFLMVIYHEWERAMIAMMGTAAPHDQRYKWLEDTGVGFDKARMEEIRLLLQVTKHENNKAGARLKEIRPELFKGNGTGHADVFLRPGHMAEFIYAMRRAVPCSTTMAWISNALHRRSAV